MKQKQFHFVSLGSHTGSSVQERSCKASPVSACSMSTRAWELFEHAKFNIPSLSIDDISFVPNEDFLGPISVIFR